MGKYENLEKKLCKELEALDEKYRSGAELTESDLRKSDMLAHTLKSLAGYRKMMEESYMEENWNGYSNSYGNSNNSYANSYGQPRDSMGRYTSRDMGPMSGYPYPERRW